MTTVFSAIWQVSLNACFITVAVIAARFLLNRAPKGMLMWLWALVALRLIMPFSVESAWSLVPETAALMPSSAATSVSTLATDMPFSDNATVTIPTVPTQTTVVSVTTQPTAVPTQASLSSQTTVTTVTAAASVATATTAPTVPPTSQKSVPWMTVGAYGWIIGMAAMVVYGVWSAWRLHRRVQVSSRVDDNVWVCDAIESPFILGVVRPRIYCPSALPEGQRPYVIAHERAHIRHGDHLLKILGFLLLTVYWFHPLVWVAYFLFGRDMELACDERVIRSMDPTQKARYSETLLSCSLPRHVAVSSPLAFGEVGVKSRLRSILHYKKPTIWVIIATAAVAVICAVCFLTDPVRPDTDNTDPIITEEIADHDEAELKKPSQQSTSSRLQFKIQDSDGKTFIDYTHLQSVEAVWTRDAADEPVPAVNITLTAEGTLLFADATQNILGQKMSVIVGGEEAMSPVINAPIVDGELMIVGDAVATLQEAEAIVEMIGHDNEAYAQSAKRAFERDQAYCLPCKDWLTKGLAMLGLDELTVTDKGTCSFGNVYLLSQEPLTSQRVMQDTFIVLESEQYVSVMVLGTDTYVTDVAFYELDDQRGDEIIIREDTGGNGGYGSYLTRVYAVSEWNVDQTSYADVWRCVFDSSQMRTVLHAPTDSYCFTFPMFREGYIDPATGNVTVLRHLSEETLLSAYQEDGIPQKDYTISRDSQCYRFEVADDDGDGVQELIAYFYTYSNTRANRIGEIRAVFEYDDQAEELQWASSVFLPDEAAVIVEDTQPYVAGTQTVWYEEKWQVDIPVLQGVGNDAAVNAALPTAVIDRLAETLTLYQKTTIAQYQQIGCQYVLTESENRISLLYFVHCLYRGEIKNSKETMSFTVTIDKASGALVDASESVVVDEAVIDAYYARSSQMLYFLSNCHVKTFSKEEIGDMLMTCDQADSAMNSFVCGGYVAITYSFPACGLTIYIPS